MRFLAEQEQIQARRKPLFGNKAANKQSRPSFPSLKVRPIAKQRPTVVKLPDAAKIRPAAVKFRPAVPANRNTQLPVENRLFFNLLGGNQITLSTGSTGSLNIPFGKTRGVIVTATVNLTSVLSCVDRSEFVTGNPTACRRRRRGVERLLTFDDQDDSFSPSKVEKYNAKHHRLMSI